MDGPVLVLQLPGMNQVNERGWGFSIIMKFEENLETYGNCKKGWYLLGFLKNIYTLLKSKFSICFI